MRRCGSASVGKTRFKGHAVRSVLLTPRVFVGLQHAGPHSVALLNSSRKDLLRPDLQPELKRRERALPIIFITASPDESVRQPLLKQGAVECLFKPFSETALSEAIDAALEARRH